MSNDSAPASALPAPARPALTQEEKRSTGLYGKFRVERMDGKSAPGMKHDGCEYFVLDLTHDEHAKPALIAYAKSCEAAFPALADDLLNRAAGMRSPAPARSEPPTWDLLDWLADKATAGSPVWWGDDFEEQGAMLKQLADSLRASGSLPPAPGSIESPWPARDAVERLANAAGHLLIDHNCDCEGYEGLMAALDEARRFLGGSLPPARTERHTLDEIRAINQAAAVFDGVLAISYDDQKALSRRLFEIAGNPMPDGALNA